eukprot:15469287-Alexandrium_andersonii.AAC.1
MLVCWDSHRVPPLCRCNGGLPWLRSSKRSFLSAHCVPRVLCIAADLILDEHFGTIKQNGCMARESFIQGAPEAFGEFQMLPESSRCLRRVPDASGELQRPPGSSGET